MSDVDNGTCRITIKQSKIDSLIIAARQFPSGRAGDSDGERKEGLSTEPDSQRNTAKVKSLSDFKVFIAVI